MNRYYSALLVVVFVAAFVAVFTDWDGAVIGLACAIAYDLGKARAVQELR